MELELIKGTEREKEGGEAGVEYRGERWGGKEQPNLNQGWGSFPSSLSPQLAR